MNARQLKSSILQYAMQGKIVEQYQNDESVEELFQKIQMEKDQLRKDGTIKSELALEPITNEEIPFEIPQSWKWERLGNLSSKIHYGYTASAQEKGNAKLLRITDIQNNRVNWGTVPFCTIEEHKLEALALKDRDILIARTGGTIGKSFLISSVDDISVFASYLIRVQPLTNIFEEYLIYYLQSELYWGQLRRMSAGTGQPNVNAQNLKKLILPVPPIEEQKRIVDKIKIFEEQVVIYENVYNQNEANRAKFPLDLEKSILQYAMQGKLVPQTVTDEPASVLIEKIKEEKDILIKQKIISKEKSLDPITNEEIPFNIPKSWEWIRLGDLNHIIMGQSPPGESVSTDSSGIEFHQGKTNFSKKNIDESGIFTSKPSKIAPANSLLISVRAPVGDINITNRNICIGRGIGSIRPLGNVSLEYMFYMLSMFKPIFERQATGSTFKAITGSVLKNQIFPLPPLEEQKRIVSKIEELLGVVNKLNV